MPDQFSGTSKFLILFLIVRPLLFLNFTFFLSEPFIAQKAQKDFQIWANVEVEAPLNKRIMLHLQTQSRFVNNASSYGYSYFDVGALCKITKNLRFTFNTISHLLLVQC